MKRATLFWLVLFGLMLLSATALAPDLGLAKPAHPEPRLLSVNIHADWCPACQHIAPTYQKIRNQYGSRIRFVEFNVTTNKTTRQATLKAKKMGLSKWFNTYQSQTSTVALMDAHTHQAIHLFQNEADPKAYQTIYNQALANRRAP